MTSRRNYRYLGNYLTFYYEYLPHVKNYPEDQKKTTIDEAESTQAEKQK